MLQCEYSLKYNDWPSVNVFDLASPEVNRTIRGYLNWEEAITFIDSEATKFMNELEDAGQRGVTIERIKDNTIILVKYHEGEFERYRRFYIEKRDIHCSDDDIEQMLSSIRKIFK